MMVEITGPGYVASIYGNATMKPSVQLIYANKNVFKSEPLILRY
jgi:hypothetical protein